MSSIQLDNGSLLYSSRYDPALVAALKAAIPSSERQWDGARKAWRVMPSHADTLVQLTEQYLGERIQAPQVQALGKTAETRLLDVRYIGATKDRGNGERSASGWCDGAWSVIFPETTLRVWFEAPATPDESNTLYQVLAVSQAANPDELKKAYRRMARQWHPDVCREPGATQVFQAIQHAYAILNDPPKRARYDAGLKLAATLTQTQRDTSHEPTYRSPLRCGLIMAEGTPALSRFVVEKIFAWEDITDAYGRSLVTSWPAGADMFVEAWQ
jgi:DnaJ-domain-containing protein 1